jgi:hypothetical protein
MTDQEYITLALYIASIRRDNPTLASFLERSLYMVAQNSLPESELTYLLELTELRVYN